jgi:hypothetical protein
MTRIRCLYNIAFITGENDQRYTRLQFHGNTAHTKAALWQLSRKLHWSLGRIAETPSTTAVNTMWLVKAFQSFKQTSREIVRCHQFTGYLGTADPVRNWTPQHEHEWRKERMNEMGNFTHPPLRENVALVLIRSEARWGPELAWTLRRKERSL